MKSFRVLFSTMITLLLLSSCTIYVNPTDASVSGTIQIGIDLSGTITDFSPTRGAGSSYQVGDTISFRILTKQSGYVTLTEYGSDGRVNTFARNIYVPGGQSTIISGPDSRNVFQLAPPRGYYRVRASFTDTPTDVSRITYSGIVGEDNWTQTIVTEIRPFTIRDVAETSYYLN